MYVITHGQCHIEPELITALKQQAFLYGIVCLPSSDLPDFVPLLDRSQIVTADVLTSRAERQRRALDIVGDATRAAKVPTPHTSTPSSRRRRSRRPAGTPGATVPARARIRTRIVGSPLSRAMSGLCVVRAAATTTSVEWLLGHSRRCSQADHGPVMSRPGDDEHRRILPHRRVYARATAVGGTAGARSAGHRCSSEAPREWRPNHLAATAHTRSLAVHVGREGAVATSSATHGYGDADIVLST